MLMLKQPNSRGTGKHSSAATLADRPDVGRAKLTPLQATGLALPDVWLHTDGKAARPASVP